MNKKLGRVAAIALSAAMITSAFAMSTATAFAADRPVQDVPATIEMHQSSKTIIKVNNSGIAFALPAPTDFDLADAKVDGTTKDLSGLTPEITSVSKSGNSVSYDSTNLTAPLKAVSTGDTTFTFTVKVPDAANNKAYVANVTSTIKVVPTNALVITPAATDTTAGQDLSGSFTVSTGDEQAAASGLKLVTLGGNTAKYGGNTAKYESVSNDAYAGNDSTPTYSWASSNAGVFAVAKDATNGYTAGYRANAAGTASVSATVTGDDNRQIVPLNVTVKDNTSIAATVATDVTIAADPYDTAKTYITGDADGTVTKTDVTGKDITLDAANMTGLTVADGAKVGNITITNAPAAFVSLKVNGTTGDIVFDKTTSAGALPATVIGTGAATGTIDLSNVSAPTSTDVTLVSADDKDITVGAINLPTASTLAVTNGASKDNKVSIGSVTADTVTVKGSAAKTDAAITAAANITAATHTDTDPDASKYSNVAINSLSATDDAATTGTALTVNDAALKVNTSNKLASIATTGETNASDVTIGNKSTITALTSVKPADTFNFVAGANIGTATTDATGTKATVVSAPANSLTIGSNSTGEIAVKLLGSYKAGDSWVVTDAKGNVDLSGSFVAGKITNSNFDSSDADSAKATSTGYQFFVAGKTVTGIAMDKSAVTLGLNDSTTLSVSDLPAGAADYAKYDVQWTTDNPDFVTVSGSGKSATIKAVKYADLKADDSDNSANVTANYLAYDNTGKSYPIGTATCKVAVVPEGAAVTTVVATLPDGSTKLLQTDGSTADTVINVPLSMDMHFAFSSNKENDNAIGFVVGNGNKFATGTVSAFDKTAGEYTVRPFGNMDDVKAGTGTGVYAFGKKICTVKTIDRPFTCDTTLDKGMKVGQNYSFRVTPNDKSATFTFMTANGSKLSTSYKKAYYPTANGDYICSISAKGAGSVGVYCQINGVTYKVFTANISK